MSITNHLKIKLDHSLMLFVLFTLFLFFPFAPVFPDSENMKEFSNNIVMSPKQQIDLGIGIDGIQCEDSLTLIIKSSDGSPACVMLITKQKLIERGWGTDLKSSNPPPGALRVPEDPLYITILDNNQTSIFPIKSGETKNIELLITPKIPILESTISVEDYFGIACDMKNSTSYCHENNIIIGVSDTSIFSEKKVVLAITTSNQTSVGNYPFRILVETTFDSPDYTNPITVSNSARFDLLVK